MVVRGRGGEVVIDVKRISTSVIEEGKAGVVVKDVSDSGER